MAVTTLSAYERRCEIETQLERLRAQRGNPIASVDYDGRGSVRYSTSAEIERKISALEKELRGLIGGTRIRRVVMITDKGV